MLVSLHVKNLALIEESEVYFGNGLNILTGETGAGKSIIIGSIRLALGAAMNTVLGKSADKDCIRTGAEYALIELIFSTQKEEVIEKLRELDIPKEEDGTILIQRKILPSRTICKVNGETVGSRQLRELASLLINIHGQNDTQTLLNTKKHSQILDDFAGEELVLPKEELKKSYVRYRALMQEKKEAKETDASREKELALAQFEAEEIENARLLPGEDEELEERYRKMNNSKKIAEALSRVHLATGYEGENAAGESLSFALREIKSISSYDKEIAEMEEELLQIDGMLSDFNRNAANYLSTLEFSGEEFRQVEERLNLCNHLKNKYGNSIEEVLSYYSALQEKLERLSDYEGYLKQLDEKLKKEEEIVLKAAKTVSAIRKKYAVTLGQKLETALIDLNFTNVAFSVEVTENPEKLTEDGYDEVEFMISLNAGEPKKSLSLVASGGELSRIMLALKAIMADKEKIQTLIFDEIDAGISGKTAWKVSEKMAVLGREHQLICITHLPQIAAMADSHFVIEKEARNDVTTTAIRELDKTEELNEIARLLGSDSITEAVLANAKELKDMANQTKGY